MVLWIFALGQWRVLLKRISLCWTKLVRYTCATRAFLRRVPSPCITFCFVGQFILGDANLNPWSLILTLGPIKNFLDSLAQIGADMRGFLEPSPIVTFGSIIWWGFFSLLWTGVLGGRDARYPNGSWIIDGAQAPSHVLHHPELFTVLDMVNLFRPTRFTWDFQWY